MIWGLGADDHPSTHSMGSSRNPQHETPRTNFSHNPHFKVPPRLQKIRESSAYLATPQRTPLFLDSRGRMAQDDSTQRVPEDFGSHCLHDNGTITLNHMLSSDTANVAGTWDSLYGHLVYQPQDSAVEIGRTVNTGKGLALDWQSALAQQSLRTSLIANQYATKLAHFLGPSAPVVVPSQTASLSLPRIFVEPRSIPVNQEPSQSRRKAIVDIAQQYHRRQNYQNLLPTPPGSSSPLWSSQFSPYQGSLPTPDMASPLLSRIPKNAGYQKQRTATDCSSELRTFVYDRISNPGLITNTLNTPSTTVFQSNQAIKSETVTSRSLDVSSLAKYIQRLGLSPSNVVNPPHPGPPPNMPLPPLPSAVRDYQPRAGQLAVVTPLSPTSPESRPRSVSCQHPRSNHRACLVQRRLSSVPEEDLNTCIEHDQLSDSQHYVPQEKPVRQTSGTRMQRKQFIYSAARAPGPLPNALALKSGIPTDVAGEEIESRLRYTSAAELEAENLPAKVKLPAGHRAQPYDTRNESAKRKNDSLKENRVRGQDASRRLNSKRRGGNRIRTSSRRGQTPVKSGGPEV